MTLDFFPFSKSPWPLWLPNITAEKTNSNILLPRQLNFNGPWACRSLPCQIYWKRRLPIGVRSDDTNEAYSISRQCSEVWTTIGRLPLKNTFVSSFNSKCSSFLHIASLLRKALGIIWLFSPTSLDQRSRELVSHLNGLCPLVDDPFKNPDKFLYELAYKLKLLAYDN